MAKNLRINIRGTAVYPKLTVADTKFDAEGMYSADVRTDLNQAKPIIDKLSAVYAEHTGKKLNPSKTNLFEYEESEDGERTGVVFKVRVKNKIRNGELWDRKPKMYDTQNNLIHENVWGGTEYIVGANVYCWAAGDKKGVSLQPAAVQIINLVSGGSGGSGFDAIDGGFISENVVPTAQEAPAATPVEDDEEDNFDF